MKNEKIDNILAELYNFDPSLRGKEQELRRAIERLLAERPDVEFDAESFSRIRQEVLGFAHDNLSNRPFVIFINQFTHMKKAYIGLGAFVLVIAVAIVTATLLTKNNFKFIAIPGGRTISSEHKIKTNQVAKVGSQSFGSLSALSISGGAFENGGDAAKSSVPRMARGIGGGGGSAEAGKLGIMPPYEYPIFRYVYKGGEIKLDKESLPVYKRIKGMEAGVLGDVIGNLNLSMIDLAKLKDAKLQNLSLMQDADFGLVTYIDFIEGAVSMNENWLKWRNLEAEKCADEACWARFRMKYDKFPTDAEVIVLADGLLAEYGIDRSIYGSGEVESFWKRDYERATDKSIAYVPEVVSVVYPYLIDGQAVRDQSGNKYGVRVNVNVRVKRASGLYGLTTNNYQSSEYAMITDPAKVIKAAEKGGNPGYFTEDVPKAKHIDLELGKPELAYVQTFNYDQATGLSSELLVPALIFPVVTDPGTQYYYQRQIVVPIAKEMFDKLYENQVPTQMPLAEPAESPMIKTLETPVPNK